MKVTSSRHMLVSRRARLDYTASGPKTPLMSDFLIAQLPPRARLSLLNFCFFCKPCSYLIFHMQQVNSILIPYSWDCLRNLPRIPVPSRAVTCGKPCLYWCLPESSLPQERAASNPSSLSGASSAQPRAGTQFRQLTWLPPQWLLYLWARPWHRWLTRTATCDWL